MKSYKINISGIRGLSSLALDALIALSMLLLSAGCDSDNEPAESGERETHSVMFRISSVDTGTRGDEPADAATGLPENELINSWWIAVVDKDNKVVDILRNGSDFSARKRDEVPCDLKGGVYTLYAFANISKDDIESNAGIGFEKGKTVTLEDRISDINSALYSGLANGFTGDIPMSGIERINVDGNSTSFEVKIYRMLAKVEFEFTNASEKEITVKGLSFGNLNGGDIPLFKPEQDNVSQSSDTYYEPGVDNATFFTPIALSPNEDGKFHFYAKESRAVGTHATGHFHFSLKIDRKETMTEGSTVQTVYSADEMLYSLIPGKTGDDFSLIERNDYLKIPIRLSDYSLKPEVMFYPPIGGYPAVLKEDKNTESYIKFGSGGEFEITPYVYVNGTEALPISEYTVEDVSVEGDVSIFSTAPAYDSSTGEITGILKHEDSVSGTAVVTLKVVVDEGNAEVSFSRKIYIIKESPVLP